MENGQQQLKFLMEHRVPFALRCVCEPNCIRLVHEHEKNSWSLRTPLGSMMEKYIPPSITCFTLAPPTPQILELLMLNLNEHSNHSSNGEIVLLYVGFSYFMRVGRSLDESNCYSAPLTPEFEPTLDASKALAKDALNFLFEFVPQDEGYFAIRSHSNGNFLCYEDVKRPHDKLTDIKRTDNIAELCKIFPRAESIERATKFCISPLTISTNGDEHD